jgi:hypothetical protein
MQLRQLLARVQDEHHRLRQQPDDAGEGVEHPAEAIAVEDRLDGGAGGALRIRLPHGLHEGFDRRILGVSLGVRRQRVDELDEQLRGTIERVPGIHVVEVDTAYRERLDVVVAREAGADIAQEHGFADAAHPDEVQRPHIGRLEQAPHRGDLLLAPDEVSQCPLVVPSPVREVQPSLPACDGCL